MSLLEVGRWFVEASKTQAVRPRIYASRFRPVSASVRASFLVLFFVLMPCEDPHIRGIPGLLVVRPHAARLRIAVFRFGVPISVLFRCIYVYVCGGKHAPPRRVLSSPSWRCRPSLPLFSPPLQRFFSRYCSPAPRQPAVVLLRRRTRSRHCCCCISS